MRMLLLALLTSCTLPNPAQERCRKLEVEVDACLGTEALPIECDSLTEHDIDGLTALIDQVGCQGLSSLLPLDGDPLAASCELFSEGCSTTPIPSLQDEPTRYPLVFVNGIDVSPLFSWSDRIVEVLREDAGQDVHLAVVPPYDSTANRSQVLWLRVQQVLAETGAEKVNLVCHSYGGLDCRYLVSEGGLHWEVDASHDRIVGSVASVTTVSTAHHGTPVADVALGLVVGEDPEDAVDALATTLGEWFTGEALDHDADLRASLAALTSSSALAFNDAHPDAEGVYYQSFAGFTRPFGEPRDNHDALAKACASPDPLFGSTGLGLYDGREDHLSLALLDSYRMVAELGADEDGVEAPNDGLAPVTSSRWGTFRGCWPVDHAEQLGRGNLPDANVRNDVDIAYVYAAVAADLAERGR